MLKYYEYNSLMDIFNIYWYLYPAVMFIIIFLLVILVFIWGWLNMKIIEQYKYSPSWISFLPYGMFYFKLKLKEKPLAILFLPLFTIPLTLWLVLMPFSWMMILPSILLLFLQGIKILTLLTTDKAIWNDFDIDGNKIWFSLIPFIGLIIYIANTVRIAFSPELLHEFGDAPKDDFYYN